MKPLHLAAVGGVLVLPLASALLPEDEVKFGPAAGTVVTKSFQGNIEATLDEARMIGNGEEQDRGLEGDEGAVLAYSVQVKDHFEAMDGAKPTTLLRTFTEFFGSAESSDGDAEEGSWEEIEDATIKFAWDEEEGDYEITFEDGDGDEDALQALDPDMDYRVLLPEGAVSEGDEWEVAGTEIGSILFPGIDLRRAADADMELDGEEIPEELIEALENFLDSFEVTCTYKGGDEAAEIAVAATVTDAIDIDPSMLGDDMEEMGGEMELSVEISAEFEGTLLWDLASGHFQSMEMTGEGTLGVQMLMSIPDFDMEFENEFLASFVMEQTASCEKAE